MNHVIKKIHIYSGLTSFIALLIFGVIGIVATVLPKPDDRPKPKVVTSEMEYEVPANLDDRQLANHIQSELALPLTGSPPDWSLRRDKENNLRFRLPTPGHFHDVVVLEEEGLLRITKQPFDSWQYLFHLHELTPSVKPDDFRILLWAYYGEFNVWALIVMALSGLYLWVSTKRRKLRWAQVSFLIGTMSFLILYLALR
jgi:hypothetical protein